ncbi:ABC transporter permease [Modestobacter sp. SYSU DS0657]
MTESSTLAVPPPAPDVVSLDPDRHVPGVRTPGFAAALHAEWIKFWTVRSTRWALSLLFLLGAGTTALICWAVARDLASGEAGEPAAAFVTWGMLFAQLTAVALGTLVVTGEYGTGMIRASLTAVPRRGSVIAAKGLLVVGTLFLAGLVTAVAGYLAGNWFLDREGVGLALSDDGVLRALLGSGLYLAGVGLFGLALGLLIRNSAAAITVGIGVLFVIGNLAFALPGTWGEWVAKLLPGNAGAVVSQVAMFDGSPLLGPWAGFGVFAAETAVLLTVAVVLFRRRDA